MNYRFVGLLSAGHLVTDINQGAVAAMLPFLISQHHLSYTAAAGIVFATNIASSVVQPLFGYSSDRFSKPWLMPVGLILAGFGLALMGIVPSYRLIILVAILSGIGVAAYHPEGARLVNFVAGSKKATAMSIFGVGGSLGFAIGPLLVTFALLHWGMKGTLVLIVPVSLMAIVIATHIPKFSAFERSAIRSKAGSTAKLLQDAWGPFARLTITVMGRSIIFYGLLTFVPLYWIKVLHQSKAAGGITLTILATSAVIGNLVGGRLADHFGYRRMILVGNCLLIPFLPALILVNDVSIATLLLVPIGFTLSAGYSPTVVLGQKYLPNYIGLSSGVTLGISVAFGGVTVPLLGKIADLYGIWSALAVLASLPVLTTWVALTLPEKKS